MMNANNNNNNHHQQIEHETQQQQQHSISYNQSQLRMQTEPLQTINNNDCNDHSNNVYHNTFNSNQYRKEQHSQQQQQQQQLQQQLQQSQTNSQYNFAMQGQQVSKQQQQVNHGIVNAVNTNMTGINQMQLQQQQSQSSHIISTLQQIPSSSSSSSSQQQQQQQSNTQKVSSRVRSNHSYLSSAQLTNTCDNGQAQSTSRFFQPVYELFFEIERKLEKDMAEKLKKQIPLDETKEKMLKYEAGNIISFIKIIFDNIICSNSELKQQIIELQNMHKVMSASLSTHHNTTNQSNVVCDENSVEITCKYCKEYEQQLQKLEAEIRQHIRVQQLLKLHAENNQTKIEEVERDTSKASDKLLEITKEYEEVKKKLDEKEKELERGLALKVHQENNIDMLIEKNKVLEQKLANRIQQQQQCNLSGNSLQQQQSHLSFVKTKSIVSNKHILDSFVDDALLIDVDKTSSSKNNFSTLSTAQQLQKSQELQKHIIQTDSDKLSHTSNNTIIQASKQFANQTDRQQNYFADNNSDNTIKINQNATHNSFKYEDKLFNNQPTQNEKDLSTLQERNNDKCSEELINIQKKLRQLQKISEKKQSNQSSSLSQTNQIQQISSDLQKQLTDRNGSIEKYQKPYQLQPNTQRVNTISNLVGHRESKQVEDRNTLTNNNHKQHNSSMNGLKTQNIQQVQQAINNNISQVCSSSSSQNNNVNIYGTIRNTQQVNLVQPASTLGQREITNSNNSLNISKIQSQVTAVQQNSANQQQIQGNQQQFQGQQNNTNNKIQNKQSSTLHQHTNSISYNVERQQQNSNRTKIPKHNNSSSSSSQAFVGNNTINFNQTNPHNLSHHNLNSTISNSSTSTQFKPSSISSNSISKLASSSSKHVGDNTTQGIQPSSQNLNRTQSTNNTGNNPTTININNYVNPKNHQKGQSPAKQLSSSRQHYTSTNNNCDTDRDRNSSTGRQHSIGVYQQATQNNIQNMGKNSNNNNNNNNNNNQKSYEKLRAFMNSPKFKTDDELQNNARSLSMDGQTSYRNTNNTQRTKNNVPVQNYVKANQKQVNSSTSSHYQINLSSNNNNQNQSLLNTSTHNRSHF